MPDDGQQTMTNSTTYVTLGAAFVALQAALDPLGIEIGREVLDIWRDRESHGQEPIPADTLKALAAVVDQLLLDTAARSGS